MTYNEMSLVKMIREKRLALNYTQEYVGFRIGISQNAYSHFELGKTSLTVQRLDKIAEVLKLDVKQLLDELIKNKNSASIS